MLKKIRSKKGEGVTFGIYFLAVLIAGGHYMYQRGDWGANGKDRVGESNIDQVIECGRHDCSDYTKTSVR